MRTEEEIEALVNRAGLGGIFEIFSYSIEVPSPTGFELMPDMYSYLGELLRFAVNDKLEEVTHELDKLAEGHYTTAQTPAGLVRAMKVE